MQRRRENGNFVNERSVRENKRADPLQADAVIASRRSSRVTFPVVECGSLSLEYRHDSKIPTVKETIRQHHEPGKNRTFALGGRRMMDEEEDQVGEKESARQTARFTPASLHINEEKTITAPLSSIALPVVLSVKETSEENGHWQSNRFKSQRHLPFPALSFIHDPTTTMRLVVEIFALLLKTAICG